MSQSDPTDHALAAIASILDHPEPPREAEKAKAQPKTAEPKPVAAKPVDPSPVESKPADITPIEAEGYSKTGPGPIAAVRFKWTVRRENNEYFVDETIGENSRPIVSAPLTKEAAIKMVDDREKEARERFEQLKSEMMGKGVAAKG